MPLINCDAKALEWVCAAFLSKDKVAYAEIKAGVDQHEINRATFGLPSRLIAKVFMFRLIYGGSAFAYSKDPEFTDVSTSEKFWQRVIDKTYAKYKGLAGWHINLVREVVDSGRLLMPTGRVYRFERANGEWPRTQILNYPVQGFGADLMSIIRVSLSRRMKRDGLKSLLVSTVHDSIVVDAPQEEVGAVCELMFAVFRDLPLNFKRQFKTEFDLPLRCEVSVGPTLGDMTEITEEFLHATN